MAFTTFSFSLSSGFPCTDRWHQFGFIYVNSITRTETTKVSVPPLPTPGSARTTYTNTHFGYTLVYPTQWYLKRLSDNSFIRVFMKFDPSVPQAVAFEIRCDANTNQLNAKTYWQQKQ